MDNRRLAIAKLLYEARYLDLVPCKDAGGCAQEWLMNYQSDNEGEQADIRGTPWSTDTLPTDGLDGGYRVERWKSKRRAKGRGSNEKKMRNTTRLKRQLRTGQGRFRGVKVGEADMPGPGLQYEEIREAVKELETEVSKSTVAPYMRPM